MPTKPSAIGMSTPFEDGATIRAEVMRAQSRSLGISKSLDQPRGNGASAWFDPAAAVQQQHRPPSAGQFMRRRGPARSAADHHGIECLRHPDHPAAGNERSANDVINMPMT